MVIITDKNTQNKVYFPKNWSTFGESTTLLLKSTVLNDEYSFEVTDEAEYSDFFVFTVDFSALPDGEYKYFVKYGDDNAINSSGLVKIGAWKAGNTQYNVENEYIEYGQ